MATENRDIIITGGVLVLLGVLYFAVRPKPSIQTVPDQSETVQPSGMPPSYNMPPILTLPPYNTGNAPTMTLPDSGAQASSCGCNACSGKSTGPVSYANMTAFWNAPDTGITMPTLTKAPTLPSVTNAIQTPPAMSFVDWQKQEGLNDLYNLDTFNSANQNDPFTAGNVLSAQSSQIPGWNLLIGDERKQHAVYVALNGNLYNQAIQSQRNAADAITFA